MAQDETSQLGRGRPTKAEAERLIPLSIHVRPIMYEALARMAHRHDLSLSEYTRRILERRNAI